MLNLHRIDRLFQANRWDEMIKGLSDNGLELPVSLRIRLSQSVAAVIALALRRVLELTYGPTHLARQLTRRLLKDQLPDGSFDRDPLATATAIAALNCLTREHRPDHGHGDLELSDRPVASARERALVALAAMQADDGLFSCPDDRTVQDRAMVAAFILWLLSRDEQFRMMIRYADLLNWFEQHRGRLDRPTRGLWRLTHQLPAPSDALAA